MHEYAGNFMPLKYFIMQILPLRNFELDDALFYFSTSSLLPIQFRRHLCIYSFLRIMRAAEHSHQRLNASLSMSSIGAGPWHELNFMRGEASAR